MKKFYKVSLITAGILAAVGLVLCIFADLSEATDGNRG